MNQKLLALLLVLVLPFTTVFADEEEQEEEINHAEVKIYADRCFEGNNPANEPSFAATGGDECPPGKSTFGGAINVLVSQDFTRLTCGAGSSLYFVSNASGKCYKYRTANANKLERKEGGRWICYSQYNSKATRCE